MPKSSAKSTVKRKLAARKKKPSPKITRTRKPDNMSLEEWQIHLRREYARKQRFRLVNIGDDPIFAEFDITNLQNQRTYRLAVRGAEPGDNFCSCPDFSVNTLGTCKHVEYALQRLKAKKGASKRFKQGYHPPYSEVYLRYGAQREVCFRPGREIPAVFREYAAKFFDTTGRLKADAYDRFHLFLKNAPLEGHELRCYEDAIQFIAQLRDDAQRQRKLAQLFPKGANSPQIKKLVKAELHPYQRHGALFAANAGRCLIADDMGLGKTIQAITSVEMLDKAVGIERVLVVTPTALKHQWEREIARFAPHRTVEVINGLQPRRAALYCTDSFYKVVNYDVIHLDWRNIDAWRPDIVILDEAQRIKNWETRRARTIKRLQSPYALVLTGTPLENRLSELYSIVEFVDRFHLGPLFRFLDKHQQTDENGRVIGYCNLSSLGKTLEPILVRRTRDQVLRELPERTDKYFYVNMTPEQWNLHEENKRTVGEIVAKWKRFGFLSEKDQRRLMIALQNMRMACDSTYLLDKTRDDSVKPDEIVLLLAELCEDPTAKAVAFSQWIGAHETLISRLDACGIGYAFYHGSLSMKEREAVLARFKDDPDCRVLLATDAGGTGLNLQHASIVINIDQPWNPAVLEQRIARIHRLGQHRPVQVYHFISSGAIEEGMLGVLSFKKSLFAGVLDGGENEVFLGGAKMKRFMETVENVTDNIPGDRPDEVETPLAPAEDEAAAAVDLADEADVASTPATPAVGQEWEQLLAAGIQLFRNLTQPTQSATGKESQPMAALNTLLQQDEKTGEPYVRIPMPKPETLRDLGGILQSVAQALQRK